MVRRKIWGLGVRGGIVSLAAFIAAIAAFIGFAAPAAASTPRVRDCYDFPMRGRVTPIEAMTDSELESTAQICADAARGARDVQAPRAWLNSGKALRALGEHRLMATGDPTTLRDAATALDIAATLGAAFGGSFSRGLDESRLELARTFRLLGQFGRAADMLRDVSGDGAAVKYERAMIYLGRDSEEGRIAAYDTLSVFSNSNEYFGPEVSRALISDARTRLVDLATRLGNDALVDINGPPSTERAERAMPYYTRAVEAADAAERGGARITSIDIPGVFLRLGVARLWAAGLQSSGEPGGLDCARTDRSRSGAYLVSAGEAFDRAVRLERAIGVQNHTANAYWGLGCATMATAQRQDGYRREELERAIEFFRAGAVGGVRNQLALARAESALGNWGSARADYQAAISGVVGGPARSRIRVEIAHTFLQNHDVEASDVSSRQAAKQSLMEAARENPDNVEARLLLGRIQYLDGAYGDARTDLLAVVNSTDSTDLQKAQANYTLSQLEIAQRSSGFERRALSYADAAYESDRSSSRYRHQACVTRIIFGQTFRNGRFYCAASETGGDYPEALLYEGLYWMREAYYKSGGDRDRDWAQALRSFETGFNLLSPAEQASPLGRQLAYGKRFALYCAGLGGASSVRPGDRGSDPERAFFDQYEVRRCWP